jgi:hypothetical protein
MSKKNKVIKIIGFLFLLMALVMPGVLKSSSVSYADDIKPAHKIMPGTAKILDTAVPSELRTIQLVPGRIALQQNEQQKLDAATRQLVNQNFAADIGRSISVQPRVTVLAREGAKLSAEALLVFLAKDTYMQRSHA